MAIINRSSQTYVIVTLHHSIQWARSRLRHLDIGNRVGLHSAGNVMIEATMGAEICPIPNTHRRLEQAHYLWHQALAHYDDPVAFQANLNSCIEALRNVTFVMQNETNQIPEFVPWYEAWRARMKQDSVMAWLHNARTIVVHQADLETASSALATIHNNLSLAKHQKHVSPFLSTPFLAMAFSKGLPEPFASHRRDLVLSVERRWSASGLPDWELLDALGHAHGILSTVVAEAHQKAGQPFETRGHDGMVSRDPGGRLPCMITTREARTVRLALKDEIVLTTRSHNVEFDPSIVPTLKKRYGKPPAVLVNPRDPFAYAEALLEFAKRVLQADKFHLRFFHIRTPSGWTIRLIDARDRTEKYALLRHLANEVKSLQGDAIVEIAEAWFAPLEVWRSGGRPEESPDRKEVLVVSVGTADGLFRSYDTMFTRDSRGEIVLEDTIIRDVPMPFYMAPFCEIWGLPEPTDSESESR
jgi:hypothetical protein